MEPELWGYVWPVLLTKAANLTPAASVEEILRRPALSLLGRGGLNRSVREQSEESECRAPQNDRGIARRAHEMGASTPPPTAEGTPGSAITAFGLYYTRDVVSIYSEPDMTQRSNPVLMDDRP
jgi:hypothetical protein